MKTFIFIAVLAALAVCSNAASIPGEVTPFEEVIEFPEGVEKYIKYYNLEGLTGRQNYNINYSPILFYEEYISMPPTPHEAHLRDVYYHGDSNTMFNFLSVTNLVPGSVPTYLYINDTVAHVKLRSRPGKELSCRVEVRGRLKD